MRNFTKTRETKEQRKKFGRLSFNLLPHSGFILASLHTTSIHHIIVFLETWCLDHLCLSCLFPWRLAVGSPKATPPRRKQRRRRRHCPLRKTEHGFHQESRLTNRREANWWRLQEGNDAHRRRRHQHRHNAKPGFRQRFSRPSAMKKIAC